MKSHGLQNWILKGVKVSLWRRMSLGEAHAASITQLERQPFQSLVNTNSASSRTHRRH
jgi:hypothetical protein